MRSGLVGDGNDKRVLLSHQRKPPTPPGAGVVGGPAATNSQSTEASVYRGKLFCEYFIVMLSTPVGQGINNSFERLAVFG
jgi:hypothetical protein